MKDNDRAFIINKSGPTSETPVRAYFMYVCHD